MYTHADTHVYTYMYRCTCIYTYIYTYRYMWRPGIGGGSPSLLLTTLTSLKTGSLTKPRALWLAKLSG